MIEKSNSAQSAGGPVEKKIEALNPNQEQSRKALVETTQMTIKAGRHSGAVGVVNALTLLSLKNSLKTVPEFNEIALELTRYSSSWIASRVSMAKEIASQKPSLTLIINEAIINGTVNEALITKVQAELGEGVKVTHILRDYGYLPPLDDIKPPEDKVVTEIVETGIKNLKAKIEKTGDLDTDTAEAINEILDEAHAEVLEILEKAEQEKEAKRVAKRAARAARLKEKAQKYDKRGDEEFPVPIVKDTKETEVPPALNKSKALATV